MIEGFALGHHTADGDGWLTGSTVVLARDGAVGGVDVRGGGPGTRETDLLNPTTLVEQAHAVLLTGGSAYGLAAADGVMVGLEELGIGFRVGPDPSHVVPIVPAAVIFDLGRGGVFTNRPTAEFGRLALAAARSEVPQTGGVGAGTGARCGGLRGGFGWAQQQLPDGTSVAAAAVLNATGSAVDPTTGRLWADRLHRLRTPTAAEREALAEARGRAIPSLATTIGVVLTDATLTPARATKVAAVAHDGLARAVRPVHAMTDGDTIFCLASGRRPVLAEPRAALSAFDVLLSAAADVFTDACLAATIAGSAPPRPDGYRELAASVFA